MFDITEDKMICITRGDVCNFAVSANVIMSEETKTPYSFAAGDVVRFKVFKAKDCGSVVISKDFEAEEGAESVQVSLISDETRIGDVINKAVDYWYEIELNPDTNPQTIVGFDDAGAKIFRLYPEGGGSIV